MQSFNIGTSTKTLIKAKDAVITETPRILSSFDSVNKLFGRGLAVSSIFQLTGYQGCGKTTMMLQILEDFSKTLDTAYIGTEEIESQILEKCPRLNVKNVSIGHMQDLEEILEIIRTFSVVVVDSFQMINSELDQKSIVTKMISEAKKHNTSLGIVCQLKKDGKSKGVSDIGHLCDQVIRLYPGVSDYFEMEKAVIVYSEKNRNGKSGYNIFNIGPNGYEFDLPWFEEMVDTLPKIRFKREI